MKKILATVLAVIMVLSLAACGKKDEKKGGSLSGKLTLWTIAVEGDSNYPAYRTERKGILP